MSRWITRCAVLAVAAGTWAMAQAEATRPAYRCGSRNHPTYSDVACPGARQVGPRPPHATNKWKDPPQDRAVIAKRARLSPEERQECKALDGQLAQEKSLVQAKGEAATIQDEMPLVRAQKRFRELKC